MIAWLATLSSWNITLLCLLTLLWIKWLWSRRHFYRFTFQNSGIFGFPIIGLVYRIKGVKGILPAIMSIFKDSKNYTAYTWLGLYPVVLTAEPSMIQNVLSSQDLLSKSRVLYRSLEHLFGGGIFAGPVDSWHHNRKILNPAFNHNVLLSFVPIFNKAKNKVVSQFDLLIGAGEHKVLSIIKRLLLELIIETSMGHITQKEHDDLLEKFIFVTDHVIVQMILSFLNFDYLYRLDRRFVNAKQYIDNFIEKLVKNKINKLSEKDGFNNGDNINISHYAAKDDLVEIKKNKNIFIDQAVQFHIKGQLSWQDVMAESFTTVGAGFETTADLIFFLIVMLAMHPEVQDKLYKELIERFPDKEFEMTYEDTRDLPYLDRVIKETLRVIPPAPIIGRESLKDVQLDDNLILPKGMQIIISIYHLHRRTDIWGPNASKFDPDNFLPENFNDKHSYAYIPFSKNARGCIGFQYAHLAVKIILTGLCLHFRFTTSFKYEDLDFMVNISLKCLKEPPIEFHRRP